ncbi:CaiB/BaiF CoA-transferase family protein [Acidocella sp. KAb 2-4]|uniref:CaiB/BaiF CoA transferase family protein n=1 Tax=Acidocella sp. KAb 2-4 TaxID=2885158 RepID=UPI001D088B80|nr:CoA transferase [Acidocella sp. KAb 2-4]MCB5944393.1 CoA transferase [Acidocella sp. KAb 2-4]
MQFAPHGPLTGIKILDFTRVLSGPYCTALLADLGAAIVKVEAPQGDEYRHVGPFRDGESALFQLVNRNKQGLALDMKQPAAREIARRLALQADVVVENFRPGVAERLGLGAEALMATNPKLIYASISGFGQSGPQAGLPAFDLVAQAMSGFMAITGEPDRPPTKIGESIGDLAAGLFASWAILAALVERNRTGQGRRLDVAMIDSLIALLPTAAAQWMFGAAPPSRVGNRHPLSTPFGTYRASDGHLVICVLNAPQFTRLATCMGLPELAADPRFATDELRTMHEPELRALIESWLAGLTIDEAVVRLTQEGVPTSAISEAADVFAGPQVADRGLLPETIHPKLGAIRTMEQPVHFSGLTRGAQRPAPALGEHNVQILREWLALSDSDIDALAQTNVISKKEFS